MVEDSFTAFLVGSFVSLITIINPPATLPIFTSVTSSLDADATRRTATSASASSTFMCPGIRPATGWMA